MFKGQCLWGGMGGIQRAVFTGRCWDGGTAETPARLSPACESLWIQAEEIGWFESPRLLRSSSSSPGSRPAWSRSGRGRVYSAPQPPEEHTHIELSSKTTAEMMIQEKKHHFILNQQNKLINIFKI